MTAHLDIISSAIEDGLELEIVSTGSGRVTSILRRGDDKTVAVGEDCGNIESAFYRLAEDYKGIVPGNRLEKNGSNPFNKAVLNGCRVRIYTEKGEVTVVLVDQESGRETEFSTAGENSFSEVYQYIVKDSWIVYVAHPVSQDVEKNLERIAEISREIHMNDTKEIPFTPYVEALEYLSENDGEQRALGMEKNKEFFNRRVIDEVILAGSRLSGGMRKELSWAEKNSIPVRLWNKDLRPDLKTLADSEDLDFITGGRKSAVQNLERELKNLAETGTLGGVRNLGREV